MVKIRLSRIGRKSLPSYRIIVSDSRRTPHSDILEDLGSYDPKSGKFAIKEEAAIKWLNNGANVSDSVKTLLTKQGIIKKYNDAKVAAKKDAAAKSGTKAKKANAHKKAKTAAKKAAKVAAKKKFDENVLAHPAKAAVKEEAPKAEAAVAPAAAPAPEAK